MASSVRDTLYRNKLNKGYAPKPATSPMDAAGLPENSVLNQPGGSVSSAWGFVPADQKQGQTADTIRAAIARSAMDARSNGDPTGLRGRMERLGPASEETGENPAAIDPDDLAKAIDGTSQMMAQADTQHMGKPAIGVSGSLQADPNYAKFIEAKRAVAQLPPMSDVEATKMGVNTPAIKSVGREYQDITKPGKPMMLGAESARSAARTNATGRQTAREAARQATLATRTAEQQQAADKQAEQWMMTNHPAAYAAIQQAKAEEAIAQAKIAANKEQSPEDKVALIEKNPIARDAAGISKETVDEKLLQDEIATGKLGTLSGPVLQGIHDSSNIHWGPEGLGLPSHGDKDRFLASVANSGKGISSDIASQWWDQNIAGRGIRGIGSSVRGAVNALPGLGGGPLASGATGAW